ncbi:MAG: hypothetical protein K0B07_01685 [DPANN group archaeon]|nr:hypothetical protein [DPANN group archaeon]
MKGKINRLYLWTSINDIKEKYLPKIKDLTAFGISFGKFVYARCESTEDISEAIQVAENDNEYTILYNGAEEEKINKKFQKLFDEGIVKN